MRWLWLILAVVLWPVAVLAAGVQDGGRAVVSQVMDGDTVLLDDGRLVRLVGLNAPERPGATKGRHDPRLQVFGSESQAHLKILVKGRTVILRHGGARHDRYGRVLAQLYRVEDSGAETWVQGAMLAAGMARVYTFADNRALAADMYAREDAARRDGRGLWALDAYAVRGPNDVAAHQGTFQVVAGRVVDAAKVKGTVYLNFGADWRTDFTVRLNKAALKVFKKTGVDPLAFQGHRVEARGWIADRNGPMITATHPEQIRLLQE